MLLFILYVPASDLLLLRTFLALIIFRIVLDLTVINELVTLDILLWIVDVKELILHVYFYLIHYYYYLFCRFSMLFLRCE